MTRSLRFIHLCRQFKAVCIGLFSIIAICCWQHLAFAATDAEMPVHIKSNQANFDNKKGIAEYKGNVIVDQGTRHLEANKITIERDNNNRIKVMIATGNPATFSSHPKPGKPKGFGKAKIIKYYPQQNIVDLFDNAQLTHGGDTVYGPKLSYNFATEVLKGKSSTKQRTTVILQPKRAP